MREKLYWTIERFSLRYAYFLFFDTTSYLADQLFTRHKVRVWFESEYTKEGSPYRVILCRVQSSWRPWRNLKRRCCSAGISTMCPKSAHLWMPWKKRKERQIKMKLTPLKKQSKNAQRKYYAAKRGSWNGLSPVTRIVQSRKVYDRNRIRQEERRSPKD